MNGVDGVALVFGLLGFFFALNAQDEVKKLKKQLNLPAKKDESHPVSKNKKKDT